MESSASPLVAWKAAATDALAGVAGALPSLIAAVVILVAGWVLARLARRLTHRLSNGIHRLLDRVLRHGSVSSTRITPPLIAVAGEVAFWSVLLLAMIAAAGAVRLQWLTSWLNQLVIHLPNLISGLAIVIAGYFISVYLRELAGAVAKRHAVEPVDGMGRLVQAVVFSVALIVGFDQVGIDVAVLIVAFAILGGGLVTGVMVAFAVGARNHVSNLIGARHVRSALKPGLKVRIGNREGEVLEVTATHINLDTADGHLMLPAQIADTSDILIVSQPDGRGGGRGET